MEANLIHQTIEISNATFFALLEQELAAHGSVRIRVKGVSMEPMLRNNRDEVQIVPYKGEELSPRDICLFKFQGRHILHRFLRREGNLFYFQGDNVLTRVEFCHNEDIVGIVRTVYRDGKSLLPFSEGWKYRIKLHRFKQQIRFTLSSIIPKCVKQKIKRILRIN